MGFRVTHLYGLTECYGPATLCAWQEDWDGLTLDERARMMSRQGVAHPTLAGLMVADPITLEPVPKDGATMGEIVLRGNTIMKGYLLNSTATEEAFRGGWFHTGDLAVWHPDGYVEIKDRAKDVIISGGENISSLEVEEALYRHPAVMEAAVVARPDARWGETPCAFVTLRPDAAPVSADEIIRWCRDQPRTTRFPSTWSSAHCPRRRPGRSRSSCCASRPKKPEDHTRREDHARPANPAPIIPPPIMPAPNHARPRGSTPPREPPRPPPGSCPPREDHIGRPAHGKHRPVAVRDGRFAERDLRPLLMMRPSAKT